MKTCLSCEGIASTDARLCSECGGPLLLTTEVHFPLRRGEEDAAHPLLGVVIDAKYRVAGVLGRGGMGTVFRATHEVSLVPVALKVLHPRFALRPEYRARFLAEARKAGRVMDEHTARILDVGEAADGSIYIVQELVPGVTLHDWIHAQDGPSTPAIVEVLSQICGALGAAHAAGLVHRDLTPRNVMVDVRDGRPFAKVLDFGVARGAAERAGVGEEGLGVFASPPYAAPEHLEGRDVDGRADLYSLGVIAYEALARSLPTVGATPREHAAATIRGELRDLRPAMPVPPVLLRLVRRLLAREPEERPLSAMAVHAQLESIRRPVPGYFPVASVVALLLSVLWLAWTYRAPVAAAYLRLAQGYDLRLLATVGADAQVQSLQSRQLARLRFDYGNFDAATLAVELAQNGELVALRPLRAQIDARALILSTDQDGYVSLLNAVRLFSQEGPVHLKFVAAGQPPLGYAVVRIDDEPPRVSLRTESASPGVLRADTVLHLAASDTGPVSAELLVEHAGTKTQRPLAASFLDRPVTAAEILAPSVPEVAARTDVSLVLVARDAAGNEAKSDRLECAEFDLAVPQIVAVHGLRAAPRSLLVGPDGVRLRVELSEPENDLSVAMRHAGADFTTCVDVQPVGRSLDATWPVPSAAGGMPVTGRYEIEVRDRAGNSARFTEVFAFATGQPDESLSLDGAAAEVEAKEFPGRAAIAGNDILTDGLPLALLLQCNPLYEPVHLELNTVAGTDLEFAPGTGPTLRGAPGAGHLRLPRLADGRYRVVVHLREVPEGQRLRTVFEVLVRGVPFELRVPDPGSRRHLAQLLELGTFAMRDGFISEGAAWQLDPPDTRWIRGRCWLGRGDLAPRDLAARTSPHDPLLPAWRPLRGENVLAVSLADALGRSVEVLAGTRPAAVAESPPAAPGERVVEMARFWWHDQPPTVRDHEVRVEFGQSARLLLDAPLPYRVEDGVELLLDASPIRPKAIVARGEVGGVTIEFVLPFERLLAVSRLGPLTPADFAAGRASEPVPLTLSAPDGRYTFEVRVRTQRTLLEAVRLGALATSASVPASLQDVLMLPVLGPGLGQVWTDPVPAGARERDAYRPLTNLDVRNVTDCYLQADECTRRQYEDIRREVQALADGGEKIPWAAFVHFGDPLGLRRLTPEGMAPAALGFDLPRWQQVLRAGPERPICGIDFFQAYAACRAASWLLFRDPDTLRLPAGVELEIAAMGGARSSFPAPLLNGAARRQGLSCAAAVAAVRARGDAELWPATSAESSAAGDVVETELGGLITGLDFGVREWVLDLPLLARDAARPLLIERLSDHERHVLAAAALAAGDPGAGMATELVRTGSARGIALGEAELAGAAAGEHFGPEAPGVVRVLQLRRDGRGVLPGELDPHLPFIGFRLCGGPRFLDLVRAR